MSSGVKVFPSFAESAFFAGEELSCALTFKNIEPTNFTSARPRDGPEYTTTPSISRFPGADWMFQSGRSASDPPLVSPTSRPSLQGRTSPASGKSVFNSNQSHGRSQSVVVTPIYRETSKAENQQSASGTSQKGN